ncbi:DUF2971 domain-containing protein [Rhizobium sp. CNPSo 3490]|uniref:DUF2971 domain-containing protein n=1 Tax=Rhizobium sp. CNPSo 3490 TaxID=3021407 RepID=UPI00254BE146|nr:DUF2971 domain-containing protein [Rhizobium sp. CNPSo 3490]MDK4736233.1 DUF2971 domain-containing protein [Rhizobium sp. CNPSo 3490]
MKASIGMLASQLNDPETIASLLKRYSGDLLCFSLSATCQSPVMWAHYAGNNSGFVIQFDTNHQWFRRRGDGSATRLQRVSYLDADLEEVLQDPQGAFISKSAEWSYEQEWRLYCGIQHIEKTVGSAADPIHLMSFPRDAVSAVILGPKASQEATTRARDIMAASYPNAQLLVAQPILFGKSYELAKA